MSSVSFHDPLCERARGYVSLRLDGELSELEDALVEAHLERCAACKSFAIEAEGFTGELRAAPHTLPVMPIALPRHRYARARVLPVGAAAAALAVALFAGALQNVSRNGHTTIAAPAATSFVAPGSESRDLRALTRASRAGPARFSPAFLRSLRLPGDN